MVGLDSGLGHLLVSTALDRITCSLRKLVVRGIITTTSDAFKHYYLKIDPSTFEMSMV